MWIEKIINLWHIIQFIFKMFEKISKNVDADLVLIQETEESLQDRNEIGTNGSTKYCNLHILFGLNIHVS